MDLVIYKKKKEDKRVRLKLVMEVTGVIDLVVVNSDGEVLEELLSITESGVELEYVDNHDLGFSLDKEGRLKLIE